MPRRGDIDQGLRRRLAAWTRYLREKRKLGSWQQVADRMGLAQPTVVNAVNKQAGIGLDYLVALRDAVHESADTLIDEDPPEVLDRSRRE